MSIVTFRISAHVAGNVSSTTQPPFHSGARVAAGGFGGCPQTDPLKRASQHGVTLTIVGVSCAVRAITTAWYSVPFAEIALSLPTIQNNMHELVVGIVPPAYYNAVEEYPPRLARRV